MPSVTHQEVRCVNDEHNWRSDGHSGIEQSDRRPDRGRVEGLSILRAVPIPGQVHVDSSHW